MDNGQKFRSIVSTILQIPEHEITDDLSSETIDTWDSLNHINLIGAIEQEFGLTLDASTLSQFQSIFKLKAMLAEHGVSV
ncbi:MAG: acyl carrier protein [Phycisphaerales bacterium]|nr:acyl carrier protein [Phycisphaerales bacterium]